MNFAKENHIHDRLPPWQCVLICWGEKYSTAIINNLADSIARFAAVTPRFILITDREKPGLRSGITCVDFPAHWLDAPLRRSGCQAKLAMFEQGVVPADLPTVYVDLDTVVLGDLGILPSLLKTPQTVAILQSAIVPFGPIGRVLYRLTRRRRYARGNSSLVVYHPAHCSYIAEQFRALYAQHPHFEFRPMVADERFISWAAQPHMRALPKRWVVKFTGEYMFFWAPWLYVKALLPWVRWRRKQQRAVTLNGLLIKPDKLLQLRNGDIIIDEKNRKLVWSEHTLGPMKHTIADYYAHSAQT